MSSTVLLLVGTEFEVKIKTKSKWVAKWWCDKADATVSRGFETHEDLMTFVDKQKSKNIRVRHGLRGSL